MKDLLFVVAIATGCCYRATSRTDSCFARRLRDLARLAKHLQDSEQNTKLHRCIEVVRTLLTDGFQPIVWCPYVATAEYVGETLRRGLPDEQVVTITGRMGDDERRIKIDEISAEKQRVLVATDCLSEGVNLQEKFTAGGAAL